MDGKNRREVDAFVRSAAFAGYLLKPRTARAPGKSENPKEARGEFVPLAVLAEELARAIGAKSRVLRLTDRVADKMWRRHGPGARKARDRRRKNVPPKWYADIPSTLQEVTPRKSGERWLFYSIRLKRLLVLGLDESGNPVMLTYHGRKNPKE